MGKKLYNSRMAKKKKIFESYLGDIDIDLSHYNGQDINNIMLEIHQDCEYLADCCAPPQIIKNQHELLSRLVKTYGH